MADDDIPPPPPPRPEGCEHCEKPCGVFFTHVDASGATAFGMCADCPKAKALLDPATFTPLPTAGEATAGPRCPACGFTQEDFNRENRFGCPHCYATFSDFVHRVLETTQPTFSHGGKHPAKHHGALTRSRLQAAREELKRAVTHEDFESAARLRDEIRALEATLPPPASPGAPPPEV